ncbi:hypothetical protein ACU8KH_04423 [Lachancea thermotolerans]
MPQQIAKSVAPLSFSNSSSVDPCSSPEKTNVFKGQLSVTFNACLAQYRYVGVPSTTF